MEGRSDDIIYLKDLQGRDIPIHPIHFHSIIGVFREIKQYQVVHEEDGLHIGIVLREKTSGEEIANMFKERLRGNLESLGASCPDIHVQFVEMMERDPRLMGKLKLVKSNIKRRCI